MAYCAAVVTSINLTVVALCFSQMPFLAASGFQFWTLAGVINAADRRVRQKRQSCSLSLSVRTA